MATHKSKVPGIYYKTESISSSLYLTVFHHSGLIIKDFSGGPTKGVRKIIEHLDEILALGKWDLGVDEVKTEANQYIHRMLFVSYSDFRSSYVVDRHFLKNKQEFLKDMAIRVKNLSCLPDFS